MIFDKIENFNNYKGISTNLDKALDFMANLDVNALKPGKYELDGKNLYYMVAEYETKAVEDGKYESHKKYIDIQLLVSGSEHIRCAPYNNQKAIVEYNTEKDIEFFALEKGYDLNLVPGLFVLLMPGELHAPNMMDHKKMGVKKVVIKILV